MSAERGWDERERRMAQEMYSVGDSFVVIADRLGKSKAAVKAFFYTHPEMYESPEAKERSKSWKNREQLCVGCARASGGYGCPWVDRFEPVSGWTAERVEQPESALIGGTWYYISACPLFVPDKMRKTLGKPKMYIGGENEA